MESGIVRQVMLEDQEFSFELCRKPDQSFGPAVIDHWWMQVTPLYGQRQGVGANDKNRSAICSLYWAATQLDGSVGVRDAQERYLLSSIVPYVRAEGSRKIFADAYLARGDGRHRRHRERELNELLKAGRLAELSKQQFHQQSWPLLGKSDFPAGIQEIYNRLAGELLDAPCDLLARGDVVSALTLVKDQWDKLMRTIGRRANKHHEKIVLDALSYESRAAFHHCYSLTWLHLISQLCRDAGLNSATATFHRFWHTAYIDPSTHESLFHGHVFGLHPATGTFAATSVGRELIGEWLMSTDADKPLRHLLNGIFTAVYQYAEQRDHGAKKRLSHETDDDPETAYSEKIGRRRGRHPHR